MIFTFYSYNGGVGRTMALANMARLFFEAGKKVLAVDWDLEAPGLERYFFSDKEKLERIKDHPGLMDMLLNYKEEMAREPEEDKEPELESPSKYLIDVFPDDTEGGKLYFLGPGRRSKSYFSNYARSVLGFDWEDFYKKWEGELYFNWLKEQFETIADVILIDSRTGVTEMGGVCTYHLADVVLCFCSANGQCIDGTLQMANNFSDPKLSKLRKNGKLKTIVVPARIEKGSELETLNEFRKSFIDSFKTFMTEELNDDPDLFEQLEIPYVPKYAFKEIIAVKHRSGSELYAPQLNEPFRKLHGMLNGILQLKPEVSSESFEQPAIKMETVIPRIRSLDPVLYPLDGKDFTETEFVDQFYKLICESVKPPFSISIDGKWGSGKTTIMIMLEKRLRKNGFFTFRFNPWEHSPSSDLLLDFIKRFSKLNMNETLDLRNSFYQFLRADALQTAKADLDETLKYRFISTTNRLSEKHNHKPVVVFIDDLDRCPPNEAVQFLMGLKNNCFSSVNNCVFICAISTKIGKQFISKYFNEADEGFAIDYFRKIFDLTIHMPRKLDFHAILANYVRIRYPDTVEPDEFVSSLYRLGSYMGVSTINKYLKVVNHFSILQKVDVKLGAGEERDLIILLLLVKECWQPLYEIIMSVAMKDPKANLENIVLRAFNRDVFSRQSDLLLGLMAPRLKNMELANFISKYPFF